VSVDDRVPLLLGDVLEQVEAEDARAQHRFQTLSAGSTAITGWTVGGAGIDWIDTFWTAEDGSKSLDVNAEAPGAISRDLATTASNTYAVQFHLTGNQARARTRPRPGQDVLPPGGLSKTPSEPSTQTGSSVAVLDGPIDRPGARSVPEARRDGDRISCRRWPEGVDAGGDRAAGGAIWPQRRPRARAASTVVPHPQDGSSTTSSGVATVTEDPLYECAGASASGTPAAPWPEQVIVTMVRSTPGRPWQLPLR
jgi:hypothetical protein